MKSNLAGKENTYENMIEYNRMKSAEGRSDLAEDKNLNKMWSVKSYMADNSKTLQGSPSLSKKDVMSNSQLTASLFADEKSIGKKETSPSNDPSMVGTSCRTDHSVLTH